jgi:membrane-associated phospholipid phosphatase
MAVSAPARAPLPEGQRDDAARLSNWLIVAAAGAVIAAIACYVIAIRTTVGQRFDDAALQGAYEQYPAERAASNHVLHAISADSFAVVLVILVVIGALRRRIRLGLGAASAAGISVIGVSILKHFVLTRPDLIATPWWIPTYNTFPSGHTATAVACALALMLVSPPRWRGVTAVVAGCYAWITAAQVQTAGWHRPSDAIGASLLAFAVVAAVAAFFVRRRPVAVSWSRPHRLALITLSLVGLGAAVATAVELHRLLWWLRQRQTYFTSTQAIRDHAYLTGVGFTIVVVVCTLLTLLILLGNVDLDHREVA